MKSYMFKTEGCCYLKTFKLSNGGREGGLSTLTIHFERVASEGLKSCPKYVFIIWDMTAWFLTWWSALLLFLIHVVLAESVTVSPCLGPCHWCLTSEGQMVWAFTVLSLASVRSKSHWPTDPSPLVSWGECTNFFLATFCQVIISAPASFMSLLAQV